jgi:TPP-dependent pyruvate/acetoin dehydrogenase alpha subunit
MGAREAAPLPDDISLLELYRRMVLVREFERLRHELWLRRQLRDDLYLALGQEATLVGLGSALSFEDELFTSRRGAGLEIARGRCLQDALRDDIAPRTRRRPERATPAGHLPLAVGAALGMRLASTNRVTLVEFGDGATGDGLFHESLNLARRWRTPIVFACINNQFANGWSSVAYPVPGAAKRAAAYEIPARTVDGQDAQAVFAAASEAVGESRKGRGPILIECLTYRIGEPVLRHDVCVEPARDEERDFWQNRDPIRRFRAVLTGGGLAHAETLAVIENAARADVDAAARTVLGFPREEHEPCMALAPFDRAFGART